MTATARAPRTRHRNCLRRSRVISRQLYDDDMISFQRLMTSRYMTEFHYCRCADYFVFSARALHAAIAGKFLFTRCSPCRIIIDMA